MEFTRRNKFFLAKVGLLAFAVLLFVSSMFDLAGASDTSYCEEHSGGPYCYTIGPSGFLIQGRVNINSILWSAVLGGLLTVSALFLDVVERFRKA